MSKKEDNSRLKRVIGLPGAVMLGLGSIIGTGVFVSLGIGVGIAGPMVLPAIAVAGLVALCNGMSSAQLAANHPVSGGTYEYGHRWLNPSQGFVAGWMFLCAKSASAATAALGFALYLAPDHSLPIALATVGAVTALTLTGMQRSNMVNTLIVAAVLLSLIAFIAFGAPAISNHPDRWQTEWDTENLSSLLPASALMFVAFTGYGRVATLGEEVAEPRRTIPRAIIATLVVTTLLYAGVAWVALANAGNEFDSLAAIAQSFSGSTLAKGLTVGAAIAMISVLLNLVLGLSRVVLAMGRRSDLPEATANISENTGVPVIATIVVGIFIAGLACLGDFKLTWSFSAFTVLVYYATTNLCAIRLKPEERLYPVWISYAGLIACLLLACFVEWRVMLAGLGLIGAGLAWKALFNCTEG
ncbi:MAG TPA: amino acid permease [Verrucomicrobiales bacterium]|nr:amino acid permease [Verrucomicrobiales bacterium]